MVDGGTSSGPLILPQLYGGVQRSTADAAFTIGEEATLVILASNVGGSRIVTMPTAIVGRHFKVIWEVEQAGNDRVFTCAGSDVVAVTITTTAITCVDDVNIGSYLEFTCGVAGTWLVTGELVVDAVGSVPTIA